MTRASVAALCAASMVISACHRQPPTFTLSVVGTNDLHGGVLEENGRGGLALLDGYVSNLRATRQADGGALLLLDAGDLFQGTLESNLTEGAVVVDAYNAIGYHAATIGNHEFDYGPTGPAVVSESPGDDPRGALKARLGQSRFPWVAANLIDVSTGTPVQWPNVSPSAMLTVGGVRVGVVGLLTREALTATMPANVTGLSMAPLEETLITEATRLRQSGATIVIALAHAGGACADNNNPNDLESCAANDEIFRVARALPPGLVDAIVGGHRHARVAHNVNGVAIIESGSTGKAFGRIDFTVDRVSGRATGHQVFPPQELCARQLPGSGDCAPGSASGSQPAEYEGRPVTPSVKVAELLKPAVARAAATKARPLGMATIAEPLARNSVPNALGNIEADWFRALVPGADAAITNSGGLRADLPAGPITYGRLYALMPFDNQRVVIRLTGAQLRTVIAENARHSGSTILVSGVRATVGCERGQVQAAIVRDSGRTIRDDESLRIVTTDFLATGGDNFFDAVMPVTVESQGGPIRDEMADMLTRTGGSWGGDRTRAPRIDVKGSRPLNCRAQ
jgi:5'-nucleotidase